MTLNETLCKHTFTAGMSESQVARLAEVAHEVRFQENEVILKAGQPSKHFYLLVAGSVCIEVGAKTYVVWVQILHPGEAFGWSALLDRHDSLFQVRARETSHALCLDGERLSSVLHGDTDLAAEFFRRTLSLVAGRVQATERRLGEMCGIRIG
jgi:CRP-like cAMP-binding protein